VILTEHLAAVKLYEIDIVKFDVLYYSRVSKFCIKLENSA